jgi:hypothetical protein
MGNTIASIIMNAQYIQPCLFLAFNVFFDLCQNQESSETKSSRVGDVQNREKRIKN